jgi:D-arabinose 1-dehydrogenase-like Zn-dependent alcohol dehydrogenase
MSENFIPTQTRALICFAPNRPLHDAVVHLPRLTSHDLLLQVLACGVCRADLKIHLGELVPPQLPIVLGQQIVGLVLAVGRDVRQDLLNSCVGIPWCGLGCGSCRFCVNQLAQLCLNPQTIEPYPFGGFADYTVVDSRFAIPLDRNANPVEVVPLLHTANPNPSDGELFLSPTRNLERVAAITVLPLGRAEDALELIARSDLDRSVVLVPELE